MPELRIARGHFDLPCRARTGLYRRPEGVRMFRKKRREKILREHEARQTQERFERNERAGKEIYARVAELKNVPRENLPDAVFMLSMAAKHQSEQIRQSIKDRTRYDFDFDTLTDGDLATYLAEDAGYALRDHVTNPQTFFEAMSEQLPDVHFTIQQQDVSLSETQSGWQVESNWVMLLVDERCLQPDLVGADRIVPVASVAASRDIDASSSTQRAAT